MTGVPTAIASLITVGIASGDTGGCTRIVARRMTSSTAAEGSSPWKVTRSATWRRSARACRAARSGPSPTSSSWASTPRPRSTANAPIRLRNPFSGSRCPTESSRAGGRGSGSKATWSSGMPR